MVSRSVTPATVRASSAARCQFSRTGGPCVRRRRLEGIPEHGPASPWRRHMTDRVRKAEDGTGVKLTLAVRALHEPQPGG
ncbi:hypothetical protein SKAU_G00381000 [Synaphobranchus kaupii]|uniref:Uncharacterized protein n=1 Tax=Synaphobranchus kaupii TaxID=118154 RepID=A0A9Q1EDN7_SYNKA|nr:hypothetical protein SKAU_G00381000 [Synaphobranchus kaupii]